MSAFEGIADKLAEALRESAEQLIGLYNWLLAGHALPASVLLMSHFAAL
jgi:hypothetical protein